MDVGRITVAGWFGGGQGWTQVPQASGRDAETKQAGHWTGTQGSRADVRPSKSQPGQESQKAGWGRVKTRKTQKTLTQKQI